MMYNYQEKDAQLFAAVFALQRGDAQQFTQVYELSKNYIYKLINDIVKEHQVTEDMMQETYILIYNKISMLQNPEAFYVWAGRIATNLTLRYLQKNRHEVLVTADEEGNTDFVFERAYEDTEAFIPENILVEQEKGRLLGEILDSLSPEQKVAVQFFYYEEMSVKEIAAACNCSEGTIKSRLNYARKSVKGAVLDLETNKDTKLYSLATLPLFYLLFRKEAAELVVSFLSGSVIADVVAKSGVAGSSVAANNGVAGISSAVNNGMTGAYTPFHNGVTGTSKVVKMAGASRKALGIKIAIGAVAAVITGGVIGGVAAAIRDDKPEKRTREVADTRLLETETEESQEELLIEETEQSVQVEEETVAEETVTEEIAQSIQPEEQVKEELHYSFDFSPIGDPVGQGGVPLIDNMEVDQEVFESYLSQYDDVYYYTYGFGMGYQNKLDGVDIEVPYGTLCVESATVLSDGREVYSVDALLMSEEDAKWITYCIYTYYMNQSPYDNPELVDELAPDQYYMVESSGKSPDLVVGYENYSYSPSSSNGEVFDYYIVNMMEVYE